MRIRLTPLTLSLLVLLTASATVLFAEEEKVGKRPYEMDWAGRTEEVREPVVDFENLDGWTVHTVNSVASFERSREEQMYGKYVGKLTYRKADGAEKPQVEIRPAEPISIPTKNFDAYSCWIVGNNWAWVNDPSTPRVTVYALFLATDGTELPFTLATVDWKEWFLCYKTLTPGEQTRLGPDVKFNGFRIVGGSNTEDRALYFDSFCAFKEERKPLDIPLRAKPGIDLFEGQPLGINSGEGRLPFPTTEDTILPDSSANLKTPMFHFYGDSCDFVYTGKDGTLVYYYTPQNGDWSDVTARWNDCAAFKPCAQGGVKSLIGKDGAEENVEEAKLVKLEQYKDGARAIWALKSKSAEANVEYRFHIQGKSLIVDTVALGGNVPSVSLGRLEDVAKPRVYTVPYYLYDYGRRPGIAVFKPLDADETLFASAHIDWYRTGASYLLGRNGVDVYERDVAVGKPGEVKFEKRAFNCAYLNGAAEYRVKTDGTRNDVYERFFFTVSPEFAETLPSIPNPKSPYRAVAGKGVWRAHGATTRDGDKAYWRNIWRHGMRHVIVTDHEVCWRDGGESFTFRTKPAPGKGGDEGWFDYCRFMQDELGFVYGPYNNFTDFAPVNEYWSPDMISRLTDGSLQRAWARCYAPKPTRAVEYCEKLTPINENKFHFSCAYCDVHSSVPPWTRVDYDARVPGAGTVMSVFYPYGEIFLLQKQNWDGPTYSEGPHHCFYAGLTDGNYAQDQPYNMYKNPWLVDFDLLKIHPQEVDFGMGNLGMFAPGYSPKTDEEKSEFIDRFLTATVAFGHSGFLAVDYGLYLGSRAYFMIQQIAARYTQTDVDSIRYFDAEGNLLDTSAALDADCVKRSQLCVRYKDGTVVVANGSTEETLETEIDGKPLVLPPNGYAAWTSDGQVVVESLLTDSGTRYDYCESPEYIYFDGRGAWTVRPKACGSGAGVCRILEDGQFEIITASAELGFRITEPGEDADAVALDADMKELGPAKTRISRGYLYIEPVANAVSYRVSKKQGSEKAQWTSERSKVARGETVVLTALGSDGQTREFTVPQDAPLGLFWHEVAPGEEIDFQIVEPVEQSLSYDSKSNDLKVALNANIPIVTAWVSLRANVGATLAGVKADGSTKAFPLDKPEKAGVETCWMTVETYYGKEGAQKASCTKKITLETKEEYVVFSDYTFGDSADRETDAVTMTPYVQVRGQAASRDFTNTKATSNFMSDVPCGGVKKSCRFIHPPYGGGKTGRTILRYDFTVPEENCAFKMSAGRKDGSDRGDGIKFQIAVAEFDGDGALMPESEKTLAETTVLDFKWTPLQANLTPYAGQKISLLVIADAGDADNSSGDWACAADMRIESEQKELVRELKSVE